MASKKLLTGVVALGTATALTLGGTYAWQSISQKALNEGSDIVNPGGRLHNDMAYIDAANTDANIYVENFADADTGDDIFARVRLSEYMEVVMNYNTRAERVEVVAGAKTLKDGVTDEGLTDDSATRQDKFDYEYAIHYFGLTDEQKQAGTDGNKSYTYWTLNEGTRDSNAVYMPTFNKNKDSLTADLNGLYSERVGGISNRGTSQYSDGRADYKVGDKTTAWAIYDADYDADDELKILSAEELNWIIFGDEGNFGAGGENSQYWKDNKETFEAAVTLKKEEHTAAQVGATDGMMSIDDWLKMVKDAGGFDADKHGHYWVYDEDGWVYWSAPIKAGTTTGLLLDSFTLNQIMDDTWYYAIDVEAQFVTADDVGKDDNSGFYTIIENTTGAALIDDTDEGDGETATAAAKPVSDKAEELLALIGVKFGGEDEEENLPVLKMNNAADNSTTGYISAKPGDSFRLKTANGDTPAEISWFATYGGDYEMVEGTDYTYKNGILTILTGYETNENLNSYGTRLLVQARVNDTTYDGAILLEDDGELTTSFDDDTQTHRAPDGTLAPVGTGIKILEQDGTSPEEVTLYFENAWSSEGDNHYTYEKGVLTITDEDWAGKRVEVKGNGSGWLIVTSGSAETPDPEPSESPDPEPSESPDPEPSESPDPEPSESPDPEVSDPGNDDTTDDDTIEEVVGSPDTSAYLKVRYKRSATSQYEPGSGACEFKFRVLYDQVTMTDKSRLTLAVTVDDGETTMISGDTFGTTTLDDLTWFTCVVPNVFSGKTGEVNVTLVMTCAGEGDEGSVSTQDYTITFTPRN